MTLPDFLTQDAYGEIHVTGSRIGLMHVVDFYNDGYSAESLHEEFPTLPLPLIKRILAFYLDNRAEVDAYVTRCHEEMDRNYANYRPGPGILKLRRLQQLLQRADAENASDPSWARLPIQEKLRRIGSEDQAEPV